MLKQHSLSRLALLACAPGLAALFPPYAAIAQTPPTCTTATVPVCQLGTPNGEVQIKPVAVPTSTTSVTPSDAYLETITVSNPTSGAITFTLADGQASPIAALAAVSIAANTTYVIVWPVPYWCPSGFTVTSSGAGLTFSGRFQR